MNCSWNHYYNIINLKTKQKTSKQTTQLITIHSFNPFIYQSNINPSIHLFIHLYIYISIYTSIYLYIIHLYPIITVYMDSICKLIFESINCPIIHRSIQIYCQCCYCRPSICLLPMDTNKCISIGQTLVTTSYRVYRVLKQGCTILHLSVQVIALCTFRTYRKYISSLK